MGHISEKEFKHRLRRIKAENLTKERKAILKAEKDKYKTKAKWPSTSKLILFGAILICLEIIIFCQYAMITLADTSAMYVLIGIPATLAPIIMSYYNKSKAENTAGGIVFETAMKESAQAQDVEDIASDEAVG